MGPPPPQVVGYQGKRLLDLVGASVALLLSAPLLLLAAASVWLYDLHGPWYVSERVGRCGVPFRFIKIRTMMPHAAESAVDTTVARDARITPVGRAVRALKVDELPQFLHVLSGRMSMVGPRPNVPREVVLYTLEERGLLTTRPGITDIASIVFADLGEALAHASDPDIAYNQLVRPWKSRLGLHYLRCASFATDLRLICFTVTGLVARRWTLARLAALLRRTGATEDLCRFVLRQEPLQPLPPPGADAIVTSRSPEYAYRSSRNPLDPDGGH
jgi:lipopolysaccharide/colanic/teichoic acid biosynthesis glycosyltransferase